MNEYPYFNPYAPYMPMQNSNADTIHADFTGPSICWL